MGDGYIRQFNDVHLVYPLSKPTKGIHVPLRKLSPFNIPVVANGYHVCIHYLCNSSHTHRFHLFQNNEMNYYQRVISWVPLDVEERLSREIC